MVSSHGLESREGIGVQCCRAKIARVGAGRSQEQLVAIAAAGKRDVSITEQLIEIDGIVDLGGRIDARRIQKFRSALVTEVELRKAPAGSPAPCVASLDGISPA